METKKAAQARYERVCFMSTARRDKGIFNPDLTSNSKIHFMFTEV
jgi:hypothetical protein